MAFPCRWFESTDVPGLSVLFLFVVATRMKLGKIYRAVNVSKATLHVKKFLISLITTRKNMKSVGKSVLMCVQIETKQCQE
jgi:hypothetical protein